MKWFWNKRRGSLANRTADETAGDLAFDELEDRIREADAKLSETRAQMQEMPEAVRRARYAQRRADAYSQSLERTYRRPRRAD